MRVMIRRSRLASGWGWVTSFALAGRVFTGDEAPGVDLFACSALPVIQPVAPEVEATPASVPSSDSLSPAGVALGQELDLSTSSALSERQLRWVTESWAAKDLDVPDESPVGRAWNTLLPPPAEYEWHHTIISGGVVTFIHTLNPLGLLNLDIFHLSF